MERHSQFAGNKTEFFQWGATNVTRLFKWLIEVGFYFSWLHSIDWLIDWSIDQWNLTMFTLHFLQRSTTNSLSSPRSFIPSFGEHCRRRDCLHQLCGPATRTYPRDRYGHLPSREKWREQTPFLLQILLDKFSFPRASRGRARLVLWLDSRQY